MKEIPGSLDRDKNDSTRYHQKCGILSFGSMNYTFNFFDSPKYPTTIFIVRSPYQKKSILCPKANFRCLSYYVCID